MLIAASLNSGQILTRLFLTMAALLALALPHSGVTPSMGAAQIHMIHAGTAHDRMADSGTTHDLATSTMCAQACTGTHRSQEPVMFAPFRRLAVVIWVDRPSGAWTASDPAPAYRPPNPLQVA